MTKRTPARPRIDKDKAISDLKEKIKHLYDKNAELVTDLESGQASQAIAIKDIETVAHQRNALQEENDSLREEIAALTQQKLEDDKVKARLHERVEEWRGWHNGKSAELKDLNSKMIEMQQEARSLSLMVSEKNDVIVRLKERLTELRGRCSGLTDAINALGAGIGRG